MGTAFPRTTSTGTRTARSTTWCTSRSSASGTGAAAGTTCPPLTRPRSRSTCSRCSGCSCWGGGSAPGRRDATSGSSSPTPGRRTLVKVIGVGLAVLVGFVPRRRDPVKVAALGAAVLLAFEIAAGHWFYLYIVWFAPFALVALFTPYVPVSEEPEAESARSNGRARLLRRRSLLPSPTGPRPTSRT